MALPIQETNARSQAPAGQGMYIPERTFPPFTHARVPGRFVLIPQHIRPFLDTTHEPIEGGFVPSCKSQARDDVNMADNYYYKLCRLPPVRHPATNRTLSAYSGVELKPDLKFSGHQFDEYIFHAVRKGRKFMFRVEKQARLMSYRHPRGLESTKCRFAKCRIDGTIRPGQIRVCISEFADPRNEILDPYHNAGYTHLYCLEEFCNLPSLLAGTNVTFLPADQLAKESSFPPALDVAEREACLQWANEARRSWNEFKSIYPIAEARPRYKPLPHERLHYRLDQIREAKKVSNKRRHGDHDGPQVFTYSPERPDSAPEPAPKRLRTLPPGISIPASIHRSGPQVYQGLPRLPHQGRPSTSHPQTHNISKNNLPIVTPLPPLPWQISSGSAGNAHTQFHTNGDEGPRPGVDYSTEEIGALLAKDFVDYLESGLEEFPWNEPPAPLAAGPQEGARPEQNGQPEQTTQPLQPPEGNQQVATVNTPVVTVGRRKSRRSSAPPVMSIQNVSVRKSSGASRRSSKTKNILLNLA